MKIIKDFVPESKWKIKCPYAMMPEFVVIHNTANDASAENEVAYMKKSPVETSYHFAVDDAEIRQALPVDRNAWHAGDGAGGKGNRYGISIEICYSKSGGERFEKAEDNAAKLVAMLLQNFGWGIERVKKHQDFSGKYCPHRTLDMGWERFVEKVKDCMQAEITEIIDIVALLSEKGIMQNTVLWLDKLARDTDSYWLARKFANYVR